MNRVQVARGIASTIPQLLTIQVQTAHPQTSEQVALAVEWIAEELLCWHDRITVGADARRTTHIDRSDPDPAPAHGTDPGLTALRTSIERGVIPGAPRTLHLAAAELSSACRSIEALTLQAPEVRDAVAVRVLTRCTELAQALRHHEDVLLCEIERLRRSEPDTQRVQIFARVVRAERGLTRTAMATLAP